MLLILILFFVCNFKTYAWSPASVHVAVNQAPGSVGREILTSSFPIAKKTTEKEKAQQPALRASSNEEEPKILSETSVEVSESASKPTPFASPSDKSLVSVDRPPSSGATYVESNINHVRGVSDIETELKNPPNKSQLHPQQQREVCVRLLIISKCLKHSHNFVIL